ncbi:MAG: outer membrane beta-barrel protein [Acidobacteriaceae bacterium]|nr:outer membrane beta-barrel protein [Acidobacteriaceae bacterium]
MKLRSLAAVAVLALTTLAAHAQVGLYLNPVAIRVSNSTADSGAFAFLGQNSTSQVFYGFDIGGYYDFFRAPGDLLTLGLDVRESDLHANNALLKSFLTGVRVSAKPFVRPIKPYVQASIGVGTTKAPSSAVHINKFDYALYGGVDYTLQKHIDWRVAEIGYGSLTTVSSASVGTGNGLSVPSSNQVSFSSGFVFRF